MVCIHKLAEWSRRSPELPAVSPFGGVLLGDPSAFRVIEVINPHMQAADGSLNEIDQARALDQWTQLRHCYRQLGLEVSTLPPRDNLVDACFTANPSMVLPLPSGGREVWLGRMTHASRRPESEMHREFFQDLGLPIREMPTEVQRFEGCGDAIWHPGRFLLHAGIGPRSDQRAWQTIQAAHPELDVLLYSLIDERFYHLDTALAPLDEKRALWVPEAFDENGRELVQAAFPEAIALPLDESLNFAGNAHCPDGHHVILDQACSATIKVLQDVGFKPMPIDTSEFRKSGGSVFCLKLSY